MGCRTSCVIDAPESESGDFKSTRNSVANREGDEICSLPSIVIPRTKAIVLPVLEISLETRSSIDSQLAAVFCDSNPAKQRIFLST